MSSPGATDGKSPTAGTGDLTAQPFLKWAGGKRALLHEIRARTPNYSGKYLEPFLGAGAVLFDQQNDRPKLVSDFNSDLIDVYKAVRDDCETVLDELRKHRNTKEHYYSVRAWDRTPDFYSKKTLAKRAARFIYLNKTNYNGLYRVNSKGQMNVPFGDQGAADWVQAELLRRVNQFLNLEDSSGEKLIVVKACDYRETTALASESDFVYIDPPYVDTFTHYQSGGFGMEKQIELRDEVVRMTQAGVPVLLSNSNASAIHELYTPELGFTLEVVDVRRAIGSSSGSRRRVEEVLVNNFKAVGRG